MIFGFIVLGIIMLVMGNSILSRIKNLEVLISYMAVDLKEIRRKHNSMSSMSDDLQKAGEASFDESEASLEGVVEEPDSEPSFESEPPFEPDYVETFEASQPESTEEDEPEMISPVMAHMSQSEWVFSREGAIIDKPTSTFAERYPDFEKFVGENLINKIGIGILVLGIGFFVKYAIDQDWINEIGRVFIGILCGGGLIGLAHKMRKNFPGFSTVLIGGGLSVLYFTIGIAFSMYHLLSQPAAFGIMVVITSFAVVLSLLYNRIELAVLALIGGFGTPFFVSTGEGNYVVLFTYLIILNTGMLVLAWFKKWGLVNILSYAFTVMLYGGWLIKDLTSDAPHLIGDFVFGTIFYAMFWMMNLANNIRNKEKFEAPEFMILISNTFLYYLAGMLILRQWNEGLYQGLFTVVMGVVNYLIALVLHRRRSVDRNLFYLMIGLVLTFISLAAPIQLKGNHITLFWAAEAVLLLWLSQKSGITIIRAASLVIASLMLISLMMDWGGYHQNEIQPIIFNRIFVTGFFGVASLVGYYLLLKRDEGTDVLFASISLPLQRTIFSVASVVLLYWVGLFELNQQVTDRIMIFAAAPMLLWSYNFLFVAVLAYFMRHRVQQYVTISFTVAIGVLWLMYLFVFNRAVITLRHEWLDGSGIAAILFTLHFIFSAVLVGLLFELRRRLSLWMASHQPENAWWYMIPMLVIVLSAELDHVMLGLIRPAADNAGTLLTQVHRIGYPILWGCLSFGLVVCGMRHKVRTLRLVGLTLFTFIVIKLFLYDVWGMNEGGKILSFVLLGVLLLVVSFMYQKLKKMLSDE